MKSIRHYVLISSLVLSGLLASATGFYSQRAKYLESPASVLTSPPVESTMLALHNGELDTMAADCWQGMVITPLNYLLHLRDETYLAANSQPEDTTEAATEQSTEPETEVVTEAEEATEAPDVPLEFTRVDDSYFRDAVFIGDSRTVGIEAYAGFENTTFYAATSLSIYDFDKKRIPIGDTKMTIHQALQENQFKKIYLMLGINEAGTGTPDTYYQAYKEVVEEICRLQPDALLFLEGNLHVTADKSASDPVINNENIEARNQKIATLADQRRIFYIDINESPLCDKEGNLRPDFTWDQVHLQAQYYPMWKEFIMKKGIVIDD